MGGEPVERCPVEGEPAPGLVRTREGLLRGEPAGETWLYRAVPFAAPPVGDLRWRAPVEPRCYDGVRAAPEWPPMCPQLVDGEPAGDEDCLYLNIWAPQGELDDAAPRPVMFFIHGGGNSQGSATVGVGDDLLYDGQALAEDHGVIVVVIQYRIGTLGYLAHPALAAESPEGRSGNYGQLDIVAALRWVNANIGAFGGDPERVLVFGESAGARNTCIMVASPLARGLLSASMMQSGACLVTPRAEVEAEGEVQVEASGCAEAPDIAACMRALSPERILMDRPPVVGVSTASDAMKPYVDGYVLLDQPQEIIRRGAHNPVVFAAGANHDETARDTPQLADAEAYELLLRARFGRVIAEQILEVYPAEGYDSPREAYIQLTTDLRFVCTARNALRAAAAHGPTFGYLFDQNLSQSRLLRGFGAYHGAELFFVFKQMDIANYQAPPEELALSDTMGGYWSRLALAGDPNGGEAPMWPAFDETDPWLILAGDDVRVERDIRADKCDFWDTFLNP